MWNGQRTSREVADLTRPVLSLVCRFDGDHRLGGVPVGALSAV